jgi:hypothetical protein
VQVTQGPNIRVPLCAISLNRETGLYEYAIWFDGQPPHDSADTFTCLQHVIWWVDPQSERIWEDVNDAESGLLKMSRGYKPGSVMDKMSRWKAVA